MTEHSKRKSEAIPIASAAFHGVAGDWVNLIGPHSEADPVALLVDLLTTVGVMVGPEPHFMVEGTRHTARLHVVIVGNTARARKGTSRDRVAQLIDELEDWSMPPPRSGLSTGEGLLKAMEPDEFGYVAEARLFVVEPEFARVLHAAQRPGNTIADFVRLAWDSGNMGKMTAAKPLMVKGAHISILGHITAEELLRNLDQTEMASGFANRFLWHWVRRSKRIPRTTRPLLDDKDKIVTRLKACLAMARDVGEMRFDDEAGEMWDEIYETFDDELGGMVGFLMARAEAQLLRLSMVFALLDGSHVIEASHLAAAAAVWEHNALSIDRIFGDRQGDPVSDRIYDGIQSAGVLATTDISGLFKRHQPADRLFAALNDLLEKGLIRSEKIATEGRSKTVYRIAKEAKKANEVPGLVGVDSLFSLNSLISHSDGAMNWDWILGEAEDE